MSVQVFVMSVQTVELGAIIFLFNFFYPIFFLDLVIYIV